MQVSDDPLPSSNPPLLDSPERREGKKPLNQKKQPPYIFFNLANHYELLYSTVAHFPKCNKTGVLSLRRVWPSLKLSSRCRSIRWICMFLYTVTINCLRSSSMQLQQTHESMTGHSKYMQYANR